MMELFGVRLVPRGFGWVVLPIMGGIFGAQIGYMAGDPGFFSRVNRDWVRESWGVIQLASVQTRLWLAFAILWILVVILVFLVFDPFPRYRWSGTEWVKFLTVLFGPILVGLLSIHLYSWAITKPSLVNSTYAAQQQGAPGRTNQATSVIEGIVERFTESGHQATQVRAYYQWLLAKHHGDAKTARMELVQWLETEALSRKRNAEHVRAQPQMPMYDPRREVGFSNLPPGARLGVIGKRRVAYLPDGALLAETLVGGEKWFVSIEDFQEYTGITAPVKPVESRDQ